MSANYTSFLFDLESSMSAIVEETYTDALEQAWWRDVAVTRPVTSKKERLSWFLETAGLRESDGNGQVRFEDLVAQGAEIEPATFTAGLKITKEQVDDFSGGMVGGDAVEAAGAFASASASDAAMLPQRLLAQAIRDNGTAYDGVSFFSASHPLNPFRPEVGTYSNLLTGTTYAIGGTDLSAALVKLFAAIGKVQEIKTPNGLNSRNLRVVGLLVPPALAHNAYALTGAEFLGGSSGSNDVRPIRTKQGIKPIVAPELAASYSGGSDTAYYLITSAATKSKLGAFVHADRESFAINMHGPEAAAELARSRELQYVMAGRTTMAYGHPFGLIKCTGV